MRLESGLLLHLFQGDGDGALELRVVAVVDRFGVHVDGNVEGDALVFDVPVALVVEEAQLSFRKCRGSMPPYVRELTPRVMLREGRGSSPAAGRMNASDPVYLELVDFVAGGTTPEDIIDFHPSAEAQERLADLIERERRSQVTPAEASELSHFLELEHILRMAKAKARLILANRA